MTKPRVWLAAALIGVAAIAACKRSGAPAPTSSARPIREVPAPAGLIGELYVAQPARVWGKLRTLGGGVLELLPSGYPLLISSTLGLPPLSASSFDAELPLLGAVVAMPGERIGSVFAAHVLDGRELVAKLTTGSRAEFDALPEPRSGATILARKSKPSALSLAVLDNYLLIASHKNAIIEAGAYVARTLPKRKIPSEPISYSMARKALHGPFAKALRDGWHKQKAELATRAREEQQKQGRAPDFADPMAVLVGADMAVETLLDALESADGARLSIDPKDDRLLARVELRPGKDGSLRELHRDMVTGDARLLLDLPARISAAFLQHRKAARPEEAKTAGDDWVRLFGQRLSTAEQTRVREAFTNLELGRGKSAVYAWLPGEEASIVLRSDVADAEALKRGSRDLVRLVQVPTIAAPLTHFVGKPTLRESTLRLPDLASQVTRAEVTLTQKDGTTRVEILSLIETTMALSAVGKAPKDALSELLGAATGKAPKLGNDSELVKMAAGLGAESSLVLFVDAGRLLSALPSPEPMPALVSLAKDNESVVLKVDLSRAALSTLIRAGVRGFRQ